MIWPEYFFEIQAHLHSWKNQTYNSVKLMQCLFFVHHSCTSGLVCPGVPVIVWSISQPILSSPVTITIPACIQSHTPVTGLAGSGHFKNQHKPKNVLLLSSVIRIRGASSPSPWQQRQQQLLQQQQQSPCFFRRILLVPRQVSKIASWACMISAYICINC